MKTLDEIKDEVAIEHGADNWQDYVFYLNDDLDEVTTKISSRYATEVAKQVLYDAAENAKLQSNEFIGTSFQKTRGYTNYAINDGWYFDIDKQSILNTTIKA